MIQYDRIRHHMTIPSEGVVTILVRGWTLFLVRGWTLFLVRVDQDTIPLVRVEKLFF
jgi:hypothetical protein